MLTYNEIYEYFLSKPNAVDCYPFDEVTLVFKVKGKMFGLIRPGIEHIQMNLKCDPEEALALRDQYSAVTPGYHMNKRHWNTIAVDGSIPDTEILAMIDHSYELIVK